MILDSCHSAAVPGRNFRPGPLGDPGLGQLAYDKGVLILTATRPNKLALATLREGGGRSLLPEVLVKSLSADPARRLTECLKEAEARVPQRYRWLYPEAKEVNIQLTLLLDLNGKVEGRARTATRRR